MAIASPTWEERIALENTFVHNLETEKADGRGAPTW
jgi:hypothetical protein